MRRTRIRWFTAALAAVTAALYFIIATETVTVVDGGDEPNIVFLIAGLMFIIGGFSMLWFDRRLYTWLFIGFDAFVIMAYFQVAVDRTPAYEFWGVVLRIAQIALLGLLVYVGVTRTPEESTRPQKDPALVA